MEFLLIIKNVKIELSKIFTIRKQLKLITFKKTQIILKFAKFNKYFIMSFFRIIEEVTFILKDNIQEKFKKLLFKFIFEIKFLFLNFYRIFIIPLFFKHFDLLLPICIKLNTLNFAISAILCQTHFESKY